MPRLAVSHANGDIESECIAVVDSLDYNHVTSIAVGTIVLVWTASHPHGSMALAASQLDERKV